MSIWKFLGVLDFTRGKTSLLLKHFLKIFLMNGYVSMTTLEFVCLFTVPCSDLLKVFFQRNYDSSIKIGGCLVS